MDRKSVTSAMRLNIAKKLPMMFVVLALLASAGMGTISYFTADKALLEEAEHKLYADAVARVDSLETTLTAIDMHLRTMSKNPAVIDALQDFSSSWTALVGDRENILQNAYITRNPFDLGEKHKMDSADGGTSYDAAHAKYHPYFRTEMEANGYYDVFLVNTEGDLVYSVFKEADFATNLQSGKWSDTDLGAAFRAALRNGSTADPIFFDYQPYAPSNNAPASFIATAVTNASGSTIGALIFQMPTDRLAAALHQSDGLAETEEVFIVGPDKLMRSDSRFTAENDILATEVDSPVVEAALNGENGYAVLESWHGGEVVVAYRGLSFGGTTWAVIAEESLEEIKATSDAMLRETIINTLIAMLIVGVIGFLFARSITKPLTGIATAVSDLANSEYEATLPGLGRSDEIGVIAKNLDTLRVQLGEDAKLQTEMVFKSAAFATSSAALMMIDRDFIVTEVNEATRTLLVENEEAFRKLWPTFSPDAIIGTCIDIFHKNPEHQRRMLASPEAMPIKTEINIGEMQIVLNIGAIFDDQKNYVGNVLEWGDVTEARTNKGILEAISTHQCVAEFDVSGTFQKANERFAELLGTSVSELIGRRFSGFVDKRENAKGEQAEMWQSLAAGEFVAKKFALVGSDGSSHTVRASFSGIVDQNGNTYKVVMIGSDVTEMERIATERRQTLDALGQIQAKIEFKPDGTILEANSNFCEGLGYSLEEIQGKHHRMFVEKEERESSDYATFWNRLAGGEAQIAIFKRVKKDGSPIYIQATYNPVKDNDGNVSRVVKLANDVTDSELKRLHDAKVLEEQEAAQSSVVSALSAGLSALAAGELTVELNSTFAAEYEQLRHDFNAASHKLRSAMQDVVQKAHGISGGAKQISQGADDLATRTERQAGSLEETAAAIEEMTASVESATERAETAENVTQGARKTAEAGEIVVSDTIEAMGEIDRSAEKISEIIGVIDDIAFQTNLLALNAGVEAARAGEAGRGFAVVASEVRALAQRCSDAAKEIKTLISESGDHVKRGVDLVGRTGSELKKINESVVEISGLVSAIFTSSKEQSLGLADINASVAQLDQVTQQNAAMVEESTAASHELTTEALELASLVSKFQLEGDALEQAMTRRGDATGQSEQASAAPVERARPPAKALPVSGSNALAPSEEDWEDF